jgi:hypothetical protein
MPCSLLWCSATCRCLPSCSHIASLLQTYGASWRKRKDSLHLRRMDPLDPSSDADEYLIDDLDLDVDMDLTEFWAHSDNDEELTGKKGSKGKGKGKGNGKGKPKKMFRGGQMMRLEESHYKVYSPFDTVGMPLTNLAAASSQGERVAKMLDKSKAELMEVCQLRHCMLLVLHAPTLTTRKHCTQARQVRAAQSAHPPMHVAHVRWKGEWCAGHEEPRAGDGHTPHASQAGTLCSVGGGGVSGAPACK